MTRQEIIRTWPDHKLRVYVAIAGWVWPDHPLVCIARAEHARRFG